MAILVGQAKKWGTTSLKLSISLFGALIFLTGVESSRCGNTGGEILYTNSQAAVLRADAASGGSTVVAHGQKLVQPLGIAVGAHGEIFITDSGCNSVIELNPKNGKQRVLAAGGVLGIPFGIAVEHSGDLLIANSQALVRVNRRTGAMSIISSGSYFKAPIDLAVAAVGEV